MVWSLVLVLILAIIVLAWYTQPSTSEPPVYACGRCGRLDCRCICHTKTLADRPLSCPCWEKQA